MTQNLMNKSLNMGCGLVISHSVWAKVFVCACVHVRLLTWEHGSVNVLPCVADESRQKFTNCCATFYLAGMLKSFSTGSDTLTCWNLLLLSWKDVLNIHLMLTYVKFTSWWKRTWNKELIMIFFPGFARVETSPDSNKKQDGAANSTCNPTKNVK